VLAYHRHAKFFSLKIIVVGIVNFNNNVFVEYTVLDFFSPLNDFFVLRSGSIVPVYLQLFSACLLQPYDTSYAYYLEMPFILVFGFSKETL
jgi:hypothetical protein